VLGSHVGDLCHLDLLAQLVVSLLDSQNLLIQDLQLDLLFLDVVLGVVDAKVVGVNAGFDFSDLAELLGHCVPDV